MKSFRAIGVSVSVLVLVATASQAQEVIPQVDEDAEAQAAIAAGLVGEERDSQALVEQQQQAEATALPDGEQQAAAGESPPTESLPSGAAPTQPLSDILNFQTDLFTGRFSYRVPIAVAPARQNSQPNVVLGYAVAAVTRPGGQLHQVLIHGLGVDAKGGTLYFGFNPATGDVGAWRPGELVQDESPIAIPYRK